jgi:cytochrome c
MVAHGANPKLIGRNLKNLKDVDDRFFIKEAIDLARAQSSGWVSYKWTDPISKLIAKKQMHVRRVGDLIINVGIYSEN